jgi:hypothetical protein
VAVRLAADASTGVDLVALPDPDCGDQPLLGVHQVVAGEDVPPTG